MSNLKTNYPTLLALTLGFAGLVYAVLWHVTPEVFIPLAGAYMALVNHLKPAVEKKRDRTRRERSTDACASNLELPAVSRDTKP